MQKYRKYYVFFIIHLCITPMNNLAFGAETILLNIIQLRLSIRSETVGNKSGFGCAIEHSTIISEATRSDFSVACTADNTDFTAHCMICFTCHQYLIIKYIREYISSHGHHLLRDRNIPEFVK